MARNFEIISKTVFLLLLCASVLTSSVKCASLNSHLKFLPGKKVLYEWHSLTNLDELSSKPSEYPVRLRGKVAVNAPWTSANNYILHLELISPKLTVASESEKGHTISLDQLENFPFVLVLKDGRVDKFFVRNSEQVFLKNIKKAIAGLLQIAGRENEVNESHPAGRCQVRTSRNSSTITKHKSNCFYEDPLDIKHSDSVLGVNVTSIRSTEYAIEEATQLLKSIRSFGRHEIVTNSKAELSSFVDEKQTLDFVETQASDDRENGDFADVLDRLVAANELQEESLVTEVSESGQSGDRKSFGKAVEALRKRLKGDKLGTIESARAFLQLVADAREAESKDIIEALNSKKSDKIRSQLYDILGYIQNIDVHKAVFERLHWDSEEHVELAERYLWALSFSIHPNEEILVDLLDKFEKHKDMPQKIRDTLILTMASMGRNLRKEGESNDGGKSKVLKALEATIINQFDDGKPDERNVYINALKNLRSPSTVSKLMAILRKGSLKEEALAWRALKRFDKSLWTDELLELAEKTLLQLDKRHDTSSRTLALDLLLLKDPVGDRTLSTLIDFLAGNESNFEVKQYVFQSVKMLAEKCPRFEAKLNDLIGSDKRINNYSGLAPRGLSTVLRRTIFGGAGFNGSLVSFQEISGGIVKRGAVDVVLEKGDAAKELFTLGIFAGGLSGFVSSRETEDGAAEDETSTAGMELTIMETQIRPFVFFEGNGELMGHVWSGTASDITPAFQALILIQDHSHRLRLDNGFVVEIDFKGAVSFDLSGKIEISIWSRNAQSLIRKSVGYAARSIVQLDTPFLRKRIESEASIEPRLNLEIFAEFAGDVQLCMVLSQPESSFRCDVTQEEAMPDTKHHVKLTATKRQIFPGKTYGLNRKNGEMCNTVLNH